MRPHMRTGACLCGHVRAHARTHTDLHARVDTHTHTHARTQIHTYTRPHTHAHNNMQCATHLEVQREEGVLGEDAVAARRGDEALAVGRLAAGEPVAHEHGRPGQHLLRVRAHTVHGELAAGLR